MTVCISSVRLVVIIEIQSSNQIIKTLLILSSFAAYNFHFFKSYVPALCKKRIKRKKRRREEDLWAFHCFVICSAFSEYSLHAILSSSLIKSSFDQQWRKKSWNYLIKISAQCCEHAKCPLLSFFFVVVSFLHQIHVNYYFTSTFDDSRVRYTHEQRKSAKK